MIQIFDISFGIVTVLHLYIASSSSEDPTAFYTFYILFLNSSLNGLSEHFNTGLISLWIVSLSLDLAFSQHHFLLFWGCFKHFTLKLFVSSCS